MTARPRDEWIEHEASELAIIDRATWDAVQARRAAVAETYAAVARGRLWGRPPAARAASRHLLAGLAACATCGGPVGGFVSTHRAGTRGYVYACTVRQTRGRAICGNTVRLPAGAAEAGVLDALDAQLFEPAVVQRAIAKVRSGVLRPRATDRPHAVARALARVEAQIARCVDAITMGGAEVRAVVERLRELEQRRTELWTERDRLQAATRGGALTARDLADPEADILACLADRREMCRQQPADARPLLDGVLVQRMVWTPVGEGPTG